MQAYPHHYAVRAVAETAGSVLIHSERLPTLTTAVPSQFGGPGDQWSPETLLVAAVADCFVLTFRVIATTSKLTWSHLDCDADGVLDRADGVLRFTELHLRARLVLPTTEDADRARQFLEKAEAKCLVSNSLVARPTLTTEIVTEP